MTDTKLIPFEAWLGENAGEIEQAQAFSTDRLSDVPGELAAQLSRAQSEYPRMGYLLADAEAYLIQAEAVATLEIAKSHDYLAAPERRAVMKDRIKDVKRVRDVLEVTVVALKQKSFAIMNTRNFMAAERPLSSEN
jgi:hypothetical protein